ncbi:MAG: SDR family oxidoreductase [Dehalococcoidia bacterium]|nr:SDR family oxidoreductase [Dehalococcoidia bacterium]
MEASLSGRVALITGVSRRQGIGFAIARRCAAMGADIFLTHFRPHDVVQPWGPDEIPELLAELRNGAPERSIAHMHADLGEAEACRVVVDAAVERFGHVDILICNHARSGGDGPLMEVDADALDGHWRVNARSSLLLTQAFARQHDGRPGGRVIWMTSGQQIGPMPGEVAYAASKATLAGVVATVADELVGTGILLNAVNPGPVNTGYLDPGTSHDPPNLEDVRRAFPQGRFGEPDDPARLIGWLVSDDGRWVVGQVINSDGGFRYIR